MGEHSFTLLEQSGLTFYSVVPRYPTILPQAYGTVWGRVDGVLVPFAWRGVFRTISARYANELGRKGALEDLRDLGKGILCLAHNRYRLDPCSCNILRPRHWLRLAPG